MNIIGGKILCCREYPITFQFLIGQLVRVLLTDSGAACQLHASPKCYIFYLQLCNLNALEITDWIYHEIFRLKLQTNFISRFYRSCSQKTKLGSLLTGALLEATLVLGARTALLYPLPQCPNSHAVLKGRLHAVVCMHVILGK